jgi:hypothetical protein
VLVHTPGAADDLANLAAPGHLDSFAVTDLGLWQVRSLLYKCGKGGGQAYR